MQIQRHLFYVWNTIFLHLSRLLLSRIAQRCFPSMVLVVLTVVALSLLSMPDLARLGLSTLHLLNKVPFGDPFPP